MAGLRDRQRSSRRLRIMETARRLFNSLGYQETTLEEIASQSELSTVTVLNYFGSKGGLLVAIQTRFDDELRSGIAPVIADPPANPVEAVSEFFTIVFDHALGTLERHVWKHVWANLFLEAGTELGKGLAQNERELLDDFTGLLETLQKRGALAAAVDVKALGEVLYNLQSIRSMQLMSMPEMSRRELNAAMIRDFRLVLQPYLRTPRRRARPVSEARARGRSR
jgi:AcrR family transcriptional regulator